MLGANKKLDSGDSISDSSKTASMEVGKAQMLGVCNQGGVVGNIK